MPHIIEKTIYTFDELSDTAKERARDWWRECENQDFDTEFVIDDVVECAKILGIEIDTKPVPLMGGNTCDKPVIYWSGFSSQGDGACFEGSYIYAKGAAKAIRKHAPNDTRLHEIADDLQTAQRPYFYKLEARAKHGGRYSHSGCMDIEVFRTDDSYYADEPANAEDVKQALRSFADWIYRQLEEEYRYRMSDENVDESICINEYEFDEDGRIV